MPPVTRVNLGNRYLFSAAPASRYKVSRTFQSHSWVLFNVPSQYYCAIGLAEYLELEAVFPRVRAAIPGRITLDTPNMRVINRLRGYHPLWRSFPAIITYDHEAVYGVLNTTFPTTFIAGFGLFCSGFASRYFRNLD